MDTRSFGMDRSLRAAVWLLCGAAWLAPLTLQPGSTFTLADMTGLRVSELAARAGVAPSTVRFYERAGLLPEARRAPNGYRLFDRSAVDDLSLIGRAKSTGMSLEEVADVVATWHDGSCRTLQTRLREHLTAELGRVSEQITDLAAFRRKLEAALDRLVARDADAEARDPGLDRCGPGCGCGVVLGADESPGGEITPRGERASLPACSLGEGGLADRLDQWRALAATAGSAERDGDTVRLTLQPGMLPAVAALVAAEADCCPQSRFTLQVSAGQAFLTAEIPGIGAEPDAQHP
jgi:DNA-binding transcriptional MerR regulator